MPHCTPAPSLSQYEQSVHGMYEEIKLIVFLEMMKEITQWTDWQDQDEFSRYPLRCVCSSALAQDTA